MIRVGTSSWSDPGFVEDWYPPGLPARDRLPWYAEHFDTVEVNSTFYAIPARATVERWVEVTPDDFTFDVKLHRLLSRHRAKPDSLPRALRERATVDARGKVVLDRRLEARLVEETLEALAPLAEHGKLGALLLQLTPAFNPRDHELRELLPVVRRIAPRPLAIELRHRGWLDEGQRERTLAWFERHGVVFVCVDGPEGPAPTIVPNLDVVTSDRLAYLRAHGRNARGYMTGRSVAERFDHDYGDDEIVEIEQRAERLGEEAGEVHVMFNNNKSDYAPRAAEKLKQLVDFAGQDARR